MGGVFARAFLHAGHPVYPVLREMDMAETAQQMPSPELVLVAVAEADLHPTLETLPPAWFQRLGLLQNELLPDDWQRYGFPQPTVISAWFEKKRGQDIKVLIPTPVFGPSADLVQQALTGIGVPVRVLADEQELLFELVVKNVYIVTVNCAGLITGGTVDELRTGNAELMNAVAREVIQIQQFLTGQTFDADRVIEAMLMAFDGDPEHQCTGRSAPARLQRALEQAQRAGLAVPRLREIAAKTAA